ncbi:MAG: 1-acyl-sn-glycerol-3-phosphate acyltransferase [Oscillospiraceae bacterium]|nr:1-acyl-sn-glycerol-3-phosphate acyltransferase [Oscillospiraceae bacterium]MDE7170983.1 1-acyl-sn-glycerol-3-phosphate acyltransferase [Oscillospiraceae bacterium]
MNNKVYAFLYRIIWVFMRIFHPWKAVGADNIPEGAALLCGNHTSLGDPFYVVCGMGAERQTHVMAKAEIMKWPVIGFLLKKAGIFGVNRGKSDMAAIKEAMRVLRAGEKLLMFPEGTRVKEGETSEAHTGAAMLSTRTNTPLVPVYISPKKRRFRKTTVVFGQSYHPEFEGRKPSAEDYQRIANDLLVRVRALEEQAV